MAMCSKKIESMMAEKITKSKETYPLAWCELPKYEKE